MKISRHIDKKNDNGYNFGPITHTLGYKDGAKHLYECRIMDKKNGRQDRVLVYASNFGEVRWCLMGYLRIPMIVTDTGAPNVKHFVLPSDVGEKTFVVFVIRNG